VIVNGVTGAGLIVKVTGPEVPLVLETVTWAVPAVETSAAKIVAVSCVELSKVVGRCDPFQLTTDVASK